MPKEHSLIIKKCKNGNAKAQMKIYDLYCDAMFNVACRYLKNHEDAKDVMQEGFLKAFLNIDMYKETHTFGAWLKRIIINQCIDTLRGQHIEFVNKAPETYALADDDWQFDVSITKAAIVKSISLLEKKYNLVLTLYLIEGYDHDEISQILNIPIGTSRTHLSRGRLQLRKLLKKEYNETGY
jgi:RNA polymerase sigma-70 factor (ECF subfamily)